jgi:glycosyltransferase involved in cell wall biosynthesis
MTRVRPISAHSPLLIRAPLSKQTGYGYLSYHLLRSLARLGVPVRLVPIRDAMTEVPDELKPLIQERPAPDAWEVLFFPPFALGDKELTRRTLLFTMWESSRLRPEWVAELNKSGGVIVPCEWNAVCFSAAGVEVPLHVVPLGHDPEVFQPGDDFPAVCTFGFAGAVWDAGVRKNLPETVEAFRLAFPTEADVRLKVKVTKKCPLPPVADPRVEINPDYLHEADLAAWYRSLTALVSVSSGEGFNLHLLEAMACGRPGLACRFSGPAEFFDESVGYPIRYVLEPAARYPLYGGLWCRFDREALVEQLRRVYRDRDGAVRNGGAAAARAREFTWDRAGGRLVALLRRSGMLAADGAATGRGLWGAVKRILKSA